MKIEWSTYFRELSYLLGWSTNRNIVVLESDDWGSIRMPSNDVRRTLLDKGILSSKEILHYSLFDSIETNLDLTYLFEMTHTIRDSHNRSPIVTALCIVANPNFERISAESYETYHYEPLTETIHRYPSSDNILKLWKEGLNNGLFYPQFHGREHLNVTAWMRALKSRYPMTMEAFKYGVTSIDAIKHGESKIDYQAAFNIDSPNEIPFLKTVINDGANLFEQLMGYKASYFVPTNGPFNLELEPNLFKAGVHYLTLNKLQKEPLGYGKYRTHIRWLGKRNRIGQTYLSRNAFFEPAVAGKDWIDSCLFDIAKAFKWGKPAIISTHRVNYVGRLEPANRQNGLKQLKALLQAIVKKWPNVEFMSSPELGNLIATETSKRSST